MNTKHLAGIYDGLAVGFAEEISAISTEHAVDIPECSTWEITLNLIRLRFVYTKRNIWDMPKSSLYCVIELQKNRDEFWHIPQLLDYLEAEDFRCVYFSAIENEQRMKSCFAALTDFVVEYIPRFNELAMHFDDCRERLIAEETELFRLKGNDLPDEPEDRENSVLWFNYKTDELYCMEFYHFKGYECFLRREYEEALRQYEKREKNGTLFAYEKRLTAFIRRLVKEGGHFEAISPECASRLEAAGYDGTTKADLKAQVIAHALSFAALTLPMMGIIALVNVYYSVSTVLCDSIGVLWAPLFAALPSVFLATAIVDAVRVRLDGNPDKVRNFGDLTHNRAWSRVGAVIAGMALLLGLGMYALMFQPHMKCHGDYMLADVKGDWLPDYQRFAYSEIRSIYHVEGFYADDGEYVGRPSYILRFEDCDVDTDMYMLSQKRVKEKLLPLFEPYVDKIHYVNTKKDIQ